MLWTSLVAFFTPVAASPAIQAPISAAGPSRRTAFDIQAHRGGRGNVVESVLPAFAWALINGANTLELDNGITKDEIVVLWHDEHILAGKCQDTGPVFEGDPDYPYVGKVLSTLTLAQIKTLDCGSLRQAAYPLQATYPGTKISTLQEFFDFVSCADPEHQMRFNIESKINPEQPNNTASPEVFVSKQHEIFVATPYAKAITYESFDWRTLVGMKKLDKNIILSGLVDDVTFGTEGSKSVWFGGAQIDDFPGHTRTAKLAHMAASLGIHILSPAGTASVSQTKEANAPPWTINTLSVAERLLELEVDGLITDYPNSMRRWAKGRGLPVAPRYPSSRVLSCLAKHNQVGA
ncbi:PLC-like phosphodiesterase [Auriculariales sp. MPI-PUGE-AT-0066]|nr:PLC-like phosphodiesterase [Auriculariales sp. MPI-PUGE-AT-0066]